MITNLLKAGLLGILAFSLTGCLSGTRPPIARNDSRADEAAIWNRSSRYGAYQQYYYYPEAERYEGYRSTGSFDTYTGVDRPRNYPYQYDPGQRRLSDTTNNYRDWGMVSESSPVDPRESGLASQGYTPTSRSTGGGFEGPPKPPKKETTTQTAPPPKKTFENLPYAKPVPGRPGFVTLGPPHNNLPEIDVTGIAPGTPVEIPNPSQPGKTIQFRVP